MKAFCGLVFLTLCHCTAVFADSLVINAWTNPASAYWEDLKWSLGVRPGSGQTIMITNQGWKAVGIGPNTAQNFSQTLDVSSVILGGYTDSFNTLLLNYAGFEVPLTAGSISVGTNSAVTVLASVLNVLSSSYGSGDISIFSVLNQGEQAIVNADVINLGSLSNLGNGPGIYNETNGVINAHAISGWAGSAFNQFDGVNTVGNSLSLGGANSDNVAHYRIASGSLTAGSIELQRGDFNQRGGSVTVTGGSPTTGLSIGAGTYTLSAGTLRLPGITIPSAHYGAQNPGGFLGADATLLQTGGTNVCKGVLTAYHEYGFPGVGASFIGPGRYVLSNGVLCVTSTVRSWLGSFEQWGGWQTNAGTEVDGGVWPNSVIRTGSFTLGGGTLITPSISINLGDFAQSGGTNRVSGDVVVGAGRGAATFTLSRGLLTDLNTSLDGTSTSSYGAEHAHFTQSGGTHMVTYRLRIFGPPPDFGGFTHPFHKAEYVLNGGVLNVPNIQIAINAFFNHGGGTLTTSGLLDLGPLATWNEGTTGQQFGQLLLSSPTGSNANFSLPSGNCIVRFASSSSVAWSNQAALFINNWNGSPAGSGQHQLIFGSSASSLTPQQISQIQFRNPAGANGTFPARILSTGEIVPDRFLAVRRASNNLAMEWGNGTLQSATNVTGPYEDVSSATNPYTAPFTAPQRFFRISN